MKSLFLLPALILVFVGGSFMQEVVKSSGENSQALMEEEGSKAGSIKLPAPQYDGTVSVEKALLERRSVRTYKDEPLSLVEISQILWAAQGITDPKTGHRTAPSAMALYLLQVYLIPGKVTGLAPGLYRYQPQGHEVIKIAEGDFKEKIFKAAGQAPLQNAPAALVFAGRSERAKTQSWIYLEAGHAAQNVYLQAVSLKLGTVVMAGFKEENLRNALNLPKSEQPIYIMPIGKK